MGEGFVVRSCNCSIISVTKKVFMTGKAMLTYLTMTNLASSKLPSEIACGSTVELFWERAPSTYTLTQTGKQGCFSHHNGTPNQTRDRTEWNLADDSPKESWVTVYRKKKKNPCSRHVHGVVPFSYFWANVTDAVHGVHKSVQGQPARLLSWLTSATCGQNRRRDGNKAYDPFVCPSQTATG